MTRRPQRFWLVSWLVAYSLATTALPLVHNVWHARAHGSPPHGHGHGHGHAHSHAKAQRGGHAHAHRDGHHHGAKRPGLLVDRGSLAEKKRSQRHTPSDPSHTRDAPEHFGFATLAPPPPVALLDVARVVSRLPAQLFTQCPRGVARSSARPRAPPHA